MFGQSGTIDLFARRNPAQQRGLVRSRSGYRCHSRPRLASPCPTTSVPGHHHDDHEHCQHGFVLESARPGAAAVSSGSGRSRAYTSSNSSSVTGHAAGTGNGRWPSIVPHRAECVSVQAGDIDPLTHGWREPASGLHPKTARVSPPARRQRKGPSLRLEHVHDRLEQQRLHGIHLTAPHAFDLLDDVGPVRGFVDRFVRGKTPGRRDQAGCPRQRIRSGSAGTFG